MDDFRKKVIKELEKKLGDGYEILPSNNTKNNGLILHGICIHKKGEPITPVVYLNTYILFYVSEILTMEEIADKILLEIREEIIPHNIAEYVRNFEAVKDRIRIKVVNYDANIQSLKNMPHRKYLDLAISYYLDMETSAKTNHATAGITNRIAEIWETSEEALYRIGMENMLTRDSFHSDEMIGAIRELARTEPDEELDELIGEIERDNGPEVEVYIVSNKKRLFGACCLANKPFLQELAERTESSLIIYPMSVNEVLIFPIEKGNKDYADARDMGGINKSGIPKENRLSNSIYLYDKTKQEISIYRKGEPL